MAFSNILQKIFKSSGQGPEVNDGILSKDITIQSWSSTHNYLPGTLVKTDGGGASSKIYFAKQSTGPSESVGPQDPSLDTGNTYWSVVSVDDGSVVHKDGDESIGGTKTFSRSRITNDWTQEKLLVGNDIDIRNSIYPGSVRYAGIEFVDKNWAGFATLYLNFDPSGKRHIRIRNYSDDGTALNWLGVSYDPDSGEEWAVAPSTLESSNRGTDIITRDWIPKDTRIVHTTGGEAIYGSKVFHDIPYIVGYDRKIKFVDDTYTKGSSNASYSGIAICDKNELTFSEILCPVENKVPAIQFNMWRVDTSSANYKTSIRYALYTSSNEGYFGPTSAVNNTLNLGQNGGRWKQLFAVSSTISTSDERKKSSITSIPDEVLDVWGSVDFIQYQFNDAVSKKGSLARIHSGLIAQRIDEAFAAHNLDASRYALFCYDEWDGQPEELDENGNIVTPTIEAGNEYSLRYEEALCMEAAYNRRRVSRVEERLLALEQELAELKKNS